MSISRQVIDKWQSTAYDAGMDAAAMGARIKARREALGLNGVEFAKRAGIPAPTITRYEKGQRTPKGENLVKLADALGWSVEDVLVGPTHDPFEGHPNWPRRGAEWIETLQVEGGPVSRAEFDAFRRIVEAALEGMPPTGNVPADLVAERRRRLEVWAPCRGTSWTTMRTSKQAPARRANCCRLSSPTRGRTAATGRFMRVRARGVCLKPEIDDGDWLVIDLWAEFVPKMRVLADVAGALHVKRLRAVGEGWELAPDNGEPAIPVTDEVYLLGKVQWVLKHLA